MSQLNQWKNSVNPEKIYYDIQISNLENSLNPPPVLYFNECRNTPFLQTPEEYYMSIIRFTLDTPTLPIFIPTIETNATYNPTQNPNQTIYTFQFSYNGVYSPQIFIQWSPQNTYVEPPSFIQIGSVTVQDNTDGYYECYSFEYFISLINQQILAAFNAFAVSYGAGFPASAVAPIIAWDGSGNIARFIFENSFNDSNATPIYMYLNSPLYNLFGSLNAINLGYNTTGRNFQILVLDFGGFNTYQYVNYVQDPNVVYNVIEVIQEYSTISAWTPISSIVFTSNTLPIVSNQISKPTIFVESGILGNYGNNSNFQQVITDLVTDSGFYKPNIVYNPSAQYRLIDMTGNTPLTNIDVSVFWKTKLGQFVPFKLGSGATATLKILFTKKETEIAK
jgi:hypothetical protein